MDALLWEVLATGSPDDTIEVLIKLSHQGNVPEGVNIVAQIGQIASCRIKRGEIEKIRTDVNVVSMKASKTLSLDPPFIEGYDFETFEADETEDFQRRPLTHFTGKGTVIGIADWGFDFTHPNFLNPNGSTRFIALWDQGVDYDGVNPYGYGTIHYQDDINDALDSDYPFEILGYHPGKSDGFHQGMHGTHVMDIAAGNGTIGFSGIAPQADILLVHLATEKFKDLMGLGDSSRVFDAIHFMDKATGNQPLVINLSVGSHGDAHKGLSLIEQAIDKLVKYKNNRAVVQSCGNYYFGKTHSSGYFTQRQEVSLEWLIAQYDKTPNEIEIWHESQDDITLSLKAPSQTFVLKEQSVGRTNIQNEEGLDIGRFYYRKNEPNTQLSQILIILDEKADDGKWQILIKGQSIVSGRYETWIERDMLNLHNQSQFPVYQANHNLTSGSICNGQFNISVGAYNPKDNKIGFFSSVGPTWDGRQIPYLTAPGINIIAAKSASPYQERSKGELTTKTGTSMAAPYVTGAIALLYEASDKPLSIEEVRDKLSKACSKPVTDNATGKARYGNGLLDISQLLKPYTKELKINNKPKKEDIMETLTPSFMPIESLMESYEEQYPELQGENLADFFKSLPVEKSGFMETGDLMLWYKYAHHAPAGYGVVESINNEEALVRTNKGVKKVKSPKVGWEMKRLKPNKQKQKQEEPQTTDEPDAPEVELENQDNPSEAYTQSFIEEAYLKRPILINKSCRRPGYAGEFKDGECKTSNKIAEDLQSGIYTRDENGLDKFKKDIEIYYINKYKNEPRETAVKSLSIMNDNASSFKKRMKAIIKQEEKEVEKKFIAELKFFAMGILDENIVNMANEFLNNKEQNPQKSFKKFPILTKAVKVQPQTQEFVSIIFERLEKTLLESGGDIPSFLIISEKGVERGLKIDDVARPKFSGFTDTFVGLKIAINDTWAWKIYLNIDANDKINERGVLKTKVSLTFVFFDHFGLDIHDLIEYNDREVFWYWYALQYFFNKKPYITTIPFVESRYLPIKVPIIQASKPISTPTVTKTPIEQVSKHEDVLKESEKNALAQKINQFNPVSSDTIVINMQEFNTGITGITNYKDWVKDKAIIHNKKVNAYRKPSDIIHLVLHETAADTGDGFVSTNNENAHLSVKNNATILQFNDLVEWENHVYGFSKKSIGIEFVNLSWLIGKGIPSHEIKLTEVQKEKYKESKGYLWLFWGFGFNIYRLPTSLDNTPNLEQLEKEVELVKWLTEGLKIDIFKKIVFAINKGLPLIDFINNIPMIDQKWLQCVSYNDIKDIWKFKKEAIPEEAEQDNKNLFIMTFAYDYFPKKIKDRQGIVSHGVIYNELDKHHSDGSFLSLYTWLRISKGKDKAESYEIAKKLMKNHFIRVSLERDTAKQIILLDVKDANLVL